MGQTKEAPKAQPPLAEARQLIEEYANDLCEIIKRLHRLLN
jgi:hypothetical protein